MINTKTPDVRIMLLDLGVPQYLTEIVIPYVWFIPGAVDPDAQGIIELNMALQRGLQKLGFKKVKPTGVIDRHTAIALDQVSTPRGSWMQKSFVQLLGDVLNAMKNPDRAFAKSDIALGLAGYFEYEGVPPGPLPGPMVGLPPGPLGMGATAMDAGVELEFGQGIRSGTNIVPIPKGSGTTDAAFKNLQRQINRLLSRHPKKGRIAEDGIIGKHTFAAFQKAQIVTGISFPGDENTLEMAKHAVSIADIMESEADAMGIPKGANKGSPSTTASVSEPTPMPMTPAQAASFSQMGISKFLPLLAIAGGVAWWASTQKKPKGKPKGKSKAKKGKRS